MKIPIQLKDQLFCRVRFKEKRPFEKDWQKNGYTYDIISKFLSENYGVLTGINNLGVLDDDTPDKRLMLLFEKHFGESFRVRNHYYIRLKNWDCKKIVFFDNGEHLGELQGIGQQVVGAGSMHPSGELYDLRKDIPIKEIDFVDFIKVFGDFTIKTKEDEEKKPFINNWEGEDIKNISITNIFSSNLKKCPSCGCSTGTNFKVYPESNSYFCFHSNTGGGIWEAIAISEGIKACYEIGKSCFNDSEKEKILEVAQNNYGLKKPTPQTNNYKPQGWANSISIIKMADKYNFKSCPDCKTLFEFNDKLGRWKCPNCKKMGGLSKFAELIVESREMKQ